MAHAAACRVALTRGVIANVACRPTLNQAPSFLVSSFRGLSLAPPIRQTRRQAGVMMAEGGPSTASEIADEEAFLAEKRAKKANKEGAEEKSRPEKTPEQKAEYKARLRRKRLDRKRKLRKLGRWPPLKANVDQPSNPRKRVQRKAK